MLDEKIMGITILCRTVVKMVKVNTFTEVLTSFITYFWEKLTLPCPIVKENGLG